MCNYSVYPVSPALERFMQLYVKASVKKSDAYIPFSVKDMSPVADYITQQNGVVTIKQLEDKFRISRRWLEKQFAVQMGMSPKEFVRLTRFCALLEHVKTTPSVSWSEMIDDYGYYDQSHLIRDFQDFTGQSPTAFYKEASAVLDSFF